MNNEKKKNYNPIKIFTDFIEKLEKKSQILSTAFILFLIFLVRTFFFGLYNVPTGSMEPTMLVGESFFADKFTPLFNKFEYGDIISFNDPTYKYSKNPFKKFFEKYFFGPENWTKRLIGKPGDIIEGKIENGVPFVYRNGQKLEESYVNPYPLVHINEKAWQLGLSFPFLKEQKNRRLRVFNPEYKIDSEKQTFYNISKESILNYENPIVIYPFTPNFQDRKVDIFKIKLGPNQYWGMGDNRQGSFDSREFGKIDGSEIHGKIIFRIFSLDTPNSLIYEIYKIAVSSLEYIFTIGKTESPYSYIKKIVRPYNRWFCKVK